MSVRRIRPEVILLSSGLLATAVAGLNLLRYSAFESHPSPIANAQTPLRTLLAIPPALQILGRVQAKRCGLDVMVVEGDDEASLSLAAGHMPGSAAFGSVGNAVISGHRDTAFRPLSRIRVKDEIEVGGSRRYTYRVRAIEIVDPDTIDVLAPSRTATLTLITCYPFRYIGNAPKRFIVQAELSQPKSLW